MCVPCGSEKSSFWRTGGERAQQYQLYFTGDRVHRTDGEALAAGNMVCSEDIAVVFARERRDNKVKDVSDRHLQVLVSTLMKGAGEGVSDVRVEEYRGGTFGEDGRTTFVYLFLTNFNVDVLVSTDRKLRRMHRANQDLCQQLRDARGNSGSGSGSATATPRTHDERVDATKIGGMVIREDILAAQELRNVRRGSTYQDDIERKLVPAPEYLKQLPESLRVLMTKAFSFDMSFRNDKADEEQGHPDTISRPGPQNANSGKTDENRAYFLTTMCLNVLLNGVPRVWAEKNIFCAQNTDETAIRL